MFQDEGQPSKVMKAPTIKMPVTERYFEHLRGKNVIPANSEIAWELLLGVLYHRVMSIEEPSCSAAGNFYMVANSGLYYCVGVLKLVVDSSISVFTKNPKGMLIKVPLCCYRSWLFYKCMHAHCRWCILTIQPEMTQPTSAAQATEPPC